MEPETETKWYVLKVQTNREGSIRSAIQRRVQRDGLADDFGSILIPTEKVIESQSGKKVIKDRKMFPGYIFIEMRMTDEAWYLVRDISGVGDFTGSMGRPQPMNPTEVGRMLGAAITNADEPKLFAIDVRVGDAVKITSGPFEAFNGTVDNVDTSTGRITVLIEIFGRPTPIDFEYNELERS